MIGILLNNYDEQFIETYRSTDYCQASLDHKQFNFNLRILFKMLLLPHDVTLNDALWLLYWYL